MKKYEVKLTPLTGIHIGNGEEKDLFNYLLYRNKVGNFKYGVYSLEKMIKDIDIENKNELMKLIENDDILMLRKFFQQNMKYKYIVYSADISREFKKEYEENFDDIKNQLLVASVYRDQIKYSPVIPGSSIKGAIRTAILNYFAGTFNEIDFKRIEQNLLGYKGGAQKDPFRSVIVEDCYIVGEKIDLVTGMSIYTKKGNIKSLGIKMFIELVRGILLDGDAQGNFRLELWEDLNKIFYKNIKVKDEWDPPKKIIDNINLIINSCNNFYKKVFYDEYKKFYLQISRNNNKSSTNFIINELKEMIDDIKGNECLIRLGRFSQIESITIAKYRDKSKGGSSRTLSLYNGTYYPLGWTKLSFKLLK